MRRRCQWRPQPQRRARMPAALVLAVLSALAAACASFENMLGAAGEVGKDGPKRPLRTAGALHALYPRTDALLLHMRELAARCDAATVGSVQSDGGDLEYVTLTRSKGYMKGHLLRRRTRVAFVFGESARESFVTTQVALDVMDSVCGGGVGKAGKGVEIEGLKEVAARVLDFAEIVLVPLVNVAGRRLAEAGGWCEVGNARDVDLNRNFAESWGQEPDVEDPKKDPYMRREAVEKGDRGGGGGGFGGGKGGENGSEVQHSVAGVAAFSEWESRALRTLITNLKPTAYVSVQSGYRGALAPPGECHRGEGPRGADLAVLNAVSDRIVAKHCWTCSHQNFLDLTGRGRCGAAADWVYKTLTSANSKSGHASVAFVYTWRIYGNTAASTVDCLRAFNPMTKEVLRSVTRRWGHALFSLVEAVHDFRMDSRELGADRAAQNASRQAAAVMAMRPDTGRMDEDDKEAQSAGDSDIFAGMSRGALGARGRREFHSGVGLQTLALSVLAVFVCILCLFLLRRAVFSGKKQQKSRGRHAGNAGAGLTGNNFLKIL